MIPETHRRIVVELSTAHVTQETRRKMAASELLSASAYPTPYGGLVYVLPREATIPDSYPLDLLVLLDVARQAGGDFVLLDADVDPLPCLPVFD